MPVDYRSLVNQYLNGKRPKYYYYNHFFLFLVCFNPPIFLSDLQIFFDMNTVLEIKKNPGNQSCAFGGPDKSLVALTLWRPNRPKPARLSILLCLTPDDFIRQWGTPGSQWIKDTLFD